MNTTAAALMVLCIGVATAMLGGAGFAQAWGAPAPQTGAAQDQLNETGDRVNPEEKVEGPVSSGDSDLVGLIVDSIQKIPKIAGAVMLLQVTLMELGFPAWFALPVGTFGQIIVAIGVIEVASNREWT